MENVSSMTTDRLHVGSTLSKIVNMTGLYQIQHCSTLGVSSLSMSTAIKDSRLGKDDFKNKSFFEMLTWIRLVKSNSFKTYIRYHCVLFTLETFKCAGSSLCKRCLHNKFHFLHNIRLLNLKYPIAAESYLY